MSRLRQFFKELRTQFPADKYAEGISESLEIHSEARSVVATYDRALQSLDDDSWRTLKQKAMREFPCNIEDRGKQPFFNQLNEAFAYRFLLQRGHNQVAFVPEDTNRKKKRKTPDIRFLKDGMQSFCEVKTIGISVDEIARMKSGDVFDTSTYSQLDSPFIEKKLPEAIAVALSQVTAAGGRGLVFLIVQFDDFTLQYYRVYRQQISQLLTERFPETEVYVKFGIQGQKRIHHRPRFSGEPCA